MRTFINQSADASRGAAGQTWLHCPRSLPSSGILVTHIGIYIYIFIYYYVLLILFKGCCFVLPGRIYNIILHDVMFLRKAWIVLCAGPCRSTRAFWLRPQSSGRDVPLVQVGFHWSCGALVPPSSIRGLVIWHS